VLIRGYFWKPKGDPRRESFGEHWCVVLACCCCVCTTVRSESRSVLRLRYVDWLSISQLPLKSVVVSPYSVVKQRLKCNTGKVCNSLIQFLLTVVLSVEERVFLAEYVLREGNRYTDLVQEQFVEKFPETPCTSSQCIS
jgi:hypothetical protein